MNIQIPLQCFHAKKKKNYYSATCQFCSYRIPEIFSQKLLSQRTSILVVIKSFTHNKDQHLASFK